MSPSLENEPVSVYRFATTINTDEEEITYVVSYTVDPTAPWIITLNSATAVNRVPRQRRTT